MHDTPVPHAIRRLGMAIGILLVAAAVFGTSPERCQAQQPNSSFGTPASRQLNNPPVSPYLNLAQPGLDPAITFGAIIQPELQLRNTLVNQQNMIGNQQNQIGGITQQLQGPPQTQTPVLLETGHKTMFLDTGNYFFPISRGRGR